MENENNNNTNDIAINENSNNSINNIMSVCEVNEYIKNILDGDVKLNNIFVKGEISNFTNHKTGHFYFTVKDDKSVLRAVMFGGNSKLKFLPQNGMKVIINGRISAFVRDGSYQIYCENLEPDGVGSLYTAYEQLKIKLETEGLFAASRKKKLPKVPLKIALITSPTGAAVRDMINVLTRRFSLAKIVLFPALVQGNAAPAQLISGIKYFNSQNEKNQFETDFEKIDVIIIGRGGGSIEELWAFNDENLARVIAASKIPVISAVGHETDFTICDFAADLRAPTPSAAAELAVPNSSELKKQLSNLEKKIELLLNSRLKNYREKINNYQNRKVLKNPVNIIDDNRMKILYAEKNLIAQMQISLERKKAQFSAHTNKLEALNPLAVVSRGYSVAYNNLHEKKILKTIKQVKIDEEISVKLSDGYVNAKIVEIVGDIDVVK